MRFTTKVSFLHSEYGKIFNLLHQQEIERVSPWSKIWDYNLNRAPQRKLLANNEVAVDNLQRPWVLLIGFAFLALKLLLNCFEISQGRLGLLASFFFFSLGLLGIGSAWVCSLTLSLTSKVNLSQSLYCFESQLPHLEAKDSYHYLTTVLYSLKEMICGKCLAFGRNQSWNVGINTRYPAKLEFRINSE